MSSDTQLLFRCDYAKTNRSGCKKCKVTCALISSVMRLHISNIWYIVWQEKIDKGALRIAKLQTSPFSDDGGLMANWHHPKCVFETFAKARVCILIWTINILVNKITSISCCVPLHFVERRKEGRARQYNLPFTAIIQATTKKIECPEDIEHFDTLEDEDKKIVEDLITNYLATRKDVKTKAPAKKKQTASQSVLSSPSSATSNNEPDKPVRSPVKKPSSEPFSVSIDCTCSLSVPQSLND